MVRKEAGVEHDDENEEAGESGCDETFRLDDDDEGQERMNVQGSGSDGC